MSSNDIDNLLDAEVENWAPEAGEKLVGRLVNISEVESDYGQGACPVWEVRTSGGDIVRAVAYHTVLRNEMHASGAEVGHDVGLKYIGQISPKKGGTPYHSYRVVSQPGDGPSTGRTTTHPNGAPAAAAPAAAAAASADEELF